MQLMFRQAEEREMAKTVSSTEAKVNLGSIMDWAVENQDNVVVESRGKPRVVIVPFEAFEEYKRFREQARREAAFKRLAEIAQEVQAKNEDLSPEAADELAEEITREAVNHLVAKGKVTFQES